MTKTLALVAAALVSACSGDGSASPPPAPDPGEPNDTVATATPLTLGAPIVATITQGTDYDYFELTLPAGGATVRIRTFDQSGADCDPTHDGVDTSIQVLDAGGNYLLDCTAYPSACDDSGINWCEDATVPLPAGTSYVEVTGFPAFPFTYTLRVDVL